MANSGGFSSKRIFGALAFIVCLTIFVLGFALEKPIPSFSDMILISATSLLGLDSFKGIFTKNSSK